MQWKSETLEVGNRWGLLVALERARVRMAVPPAPAALRGEGGGEKKTG